MTTVTCAIIEKGSKVLIARRAPDQKLAGKCEYPGEKVEASERPEALILNFGSGTFPFTLPELPWSYRIRISPQSRVQFHRSFLKELQAKVFGGVFEVPPGVAGSDKFLIQVLSIREDHLSDRPAGDTPVGSGPAV